MTEESLLPEPGSWPVALPAVEVRFARPTGRLDEIVAFYRDLLGLPELARSGGDGYTVVMIGLPGERYHLEFVASDEGLDGTAPTSENLLVFYFATAGEMEAVAARVRDAGHPQVGFDNPWWERNGAVAFADPDGWRVVFMPRPITFGAPVGS